MRLRELKKRCKPINYDKLREHEKKFLQEKKKRAKDKAEIMKKEQESIEKSYKIGYTSKLHDSYANGFIKDRHKKLLKHKADLGSLQKSKDYGIKARETLINKEETEKELEQKYEDNNSQKKMNWWHGRFGKIQHNQHKHIENDKNIINNRQKVSHNK